METRILGLDGNFMTLEEYQDKYNYTGSMVGRYFSLGEPIFTTTQNRMGQVVLNEGVMQAIDEVRERKGTPMTLNALNRTKEYQKTISKGAATVSPHVEYMAVDIDTVSVTDTETTAQLLQEVCEEMELGYRLGYKKYWDKYKYTFIHFDICPYYYTGIWANRQKTLQDTKIPWQWKINKLIW